MSSFVISKNYYIQAAAFIVALAEANTREPIIYKYNQKKGRIYTREDYKQEFEHIYELNALSVQEQYGDKIPDADTDEYTQLFDESIKICHSAINRYWAGFERSGDLKKLADSFRKFTRSVLYQIENDDMRKEAAYILNSYIVDIYEFFATTRHVDAWGDFDVYNILKNS